MEQKLRIAWIHTHYSYNVGGTKFIINLLTQLSKKYEIATFVEDYNPLIIQPLNKSSVKIYKFGIISGSHLIYWIFLPLFIFYDFFKLRKALTKYDIVVSSMFPLNIVVNLICPNKHYQYIFEPFAFFYNKELIFGYSKIKSVLLLLLKFFYQPLDYRFTRRSKVIITINKAVSDWVKRVYNRTAIPTYLGVDTNFFKKVKDNKFLPQFKSKKIIIHTTDYTPLKQTAFLISAMPQILKKVKNAVLLITHPFDVPSARFSLENLSKKLGVEKQIKFLGYLSNEELVKLYSRADCAVYCGIGKGVSAASLYVLEVMACGTPVIRTATTKEEVIHGYNGYLFSPNNKAQMIEFIVKILKNKNYAKIMGANARRLVLEKYSWPVVINNFEKIFQKKTNNEDK